MSRLGGIRQNATLAHIAPFVVFMVFVEIPGWTAVENPALRWHEHAPEQWIYPFQTLLCLGLLCFFRGHYPLRPVRGLGLAAALGAAGIALWILPSLCYRWWGVADWLQPVVRIPMLDPEGSPVWEYLGMAERVEGFDASFFREHGFWYWSAILMRFVRMVIVVPLVEEIFWRSFLMRYVIDTSKPFTRTAFGTHSWRAYVVSTVFFVIVHAPVDWFASFAYGSATYWLTVRKKSLAACVLMHAVANLLLGLYAMSTKQWGFW